MKRKLLVIVFLLGLTTTSFSFWEVFIVPAVNIVSDLAKDIGKSNYEKATEAENMGSLGDAKKYYEKVIKNKEDSRIDAMNRLAEIYVREQDYEKAEKYYKMAYENGDKTACAELIILYKSLKDNGKLESFLKTELEKNGTVNFRTKNSSKEYNLALELGTLYESQGKTDLALEYYEKAVETNSYDAKEKLNKLKTALNEKKELEETLAAAEAGSHEAYYKLAESAKNNGERMAYYQKAADLGNLEAMKIVALSYFDDGEYKLSEKYFKMASDKKDEDAMGSLGLLYEYAGKYELAEKYYKLAAAKGEVNAMIDLMLLYADQGKSQSALKYYQMAIKNGADLEDIGYRKMYSDNRIHNKVTYITFD